MKTNSFVKYMALTGFFFLAFAAMNTAEAQRRLIRHTTSHRLDRLEDVRDRREGVRDRKEDIRDRREDIRDARHNGGALDRLEDIRDRREDVRDRREDVRDRKEDIRDRRSIAHRWKGRRDRRF